MGIPVLEDSREDSMGRSYAQPTPPAMLGRGRDADPFHQSPGPSPQWQPADVGPVAQDRSLLAGSSAASESTVDTPIFNAMLSKWFAERQEPAIAEDVSEPTPMQNGPAGEGWDSEADAGWRAAEAASEPTADELTPAGLPKRRPGEFLVPGTAGPDTTITPPPAAATASNAEAVRDRMSNYQRGLTLGRHSQQAGPQDQVMAGGDRARHQWGTENDVRTGPGHDQHDGQTAEDNR
jgi:hypothetical protein